ncbi:MAG: DUF4743 domain-containing protein [Rhodospirillales bacterium]|nr:DUF4743 domain-containing protein [Rhodospirillales bacterium]
MSLIDRVSACAVYDAGRFLDFHVDAVRVGGVHRDTVRHLTAFPDLLTITDKTISLRPHLATYEARTRAMAQIVNVLRGDGLVPGWRDEAYPVGVGFSAPALFQIERAAVALFGFRGYGVHLNGYVRDQGQIRLWVGKRALSKPTGPGKLDQIVAGGQPVGMGLHDNLIKECAEEASIPATLAARARPVGTISYRTSRPEGLRDDVLFNYDLELPATFQPTNSDGEVEAFYLWPIEKVRNVLERTNDFKFNSGLVVIDFMVRHGIIDADEPGYADLVAGLHH